MKTGHSKGEYQLFADAYTKFCENHDMSLSQSDTNDDAQEQDHLATLNHRVLQENERHCCSFYHGDCNNIICQACMQGRNVIDVPTATLSNRRCPNHPIAQDGTRYIFRAAYRKDPNRPDSFIGGERYYVGCVPEYFKIPVAKGTAAVDEFIRNHSE